MTLLIWQPLALLALAVGIAQPAPESAPALQPRSEISRLEQACDDLRDQLVQRDKQLQIQQGQLEMNKLWVESLQHTVRNTMIWAFSGILGSALAAFAVNYWLLGKRIDDKLKVDAKVKVIAGTIASIEGAIATQGANIAFLLSALRSRERGGLVDTYLPESFEVALAGLENAVGTAGDPKAVEQLMDMLLRPGLAGAASGELDSDHGPRYLAVLEKVGKTYPKTMLASRAQETSATFTHFNRTL